MSDDPLLQLARDFKQRAELQIEWLSSVADTAVAEGDDFRLPIAMSLVADFRTATFLFQIALTQPYDQEQRAKACEKGVNCYRDAVDRLFSARMAGLDRRMKP
ncbi:hypothetical protein [Rhizobium sp. CC-YZS058]|uniref:hypothetical protein n=1 Tax=Rhizobium sp. CC-YZS058 TaxID=3042153 RepID=UPI002B05986D|nr:hypothetical protein [Rhizobium sp. CC-YZS058]MEA3533259.1 hypothetical protein [Rhizobium sp. CC-YZS058]